MSLEEDDDVTEEHDELHVAEGKVHPESDERG